MNTAEEKIICSGPEIVSLKYTIADAPIPLARPRMSPSHVWDAQKHSKLHCRSQLENQQGTLPVIEKPIHIDFIFYMPLRDYRKKKNELGSYHCIKPDLSNLVKFVEDIANGIVFKDDCQIASFTAKKIYDSVPRTVFIVTQLD